MAVRHFFGHVAGESYRNADGTDRQKIIPRCRVGELLVLEHEPDHRTTSCPGLGDGLLGKNGSAWSP